MAEIYSGSKRVFIINGGANWEIGRFSIKVCEKQIGDAKPNIFETLRHVAAGKVGFVDSVKNEVKFVAFRSDNVIVGRGVTFQLQNCSIFVLGSELRLVKIPFVDNAPRNCFRWQCPKKVWTTRACMVDKETNIWLGGYIQIWRAFRFWTWIDKRFQYLKSTV